MSRAPASRHGAGRRRFRRAGAVTLSAGVLLATACGGPTEDERAVCDTLQQLVDHLEDGSSLAAVQTMYTLDERVTATSNPTLAAAGSHLFETISQPVDIGSLTPAQSSALGDQVLAEAQPDLQTLFDTCGKIGLAIEVDESALRPER